MSLEIERIWNQSVDFIATMGLALLDFIATMGLALLWNALAAIAIFYVGRWIAKILLRILTQLMTRAKIDETLIRFLENIAYALMIMFVVMAAIEQLGVDTTSFAAMIAAAGLAIGFALQGSLSNFASGVMLILFAPFKVGDYVEAGGSAGTVEEIDIFNTRMRTGENIQIIIPNNKITSGTITNFSAKDTRRIDMEIGCGYGDDLKAVKAFLTQVIADEPRILADPEPLIAVNELGESSVNFVVRPWVNSGDYWNVRRELTETIKLGFDERGFSFPYPSRDVHLHQVTT